MGVNYEKQQDNAAIFKSLKVQFHHFSFKESKL